MDPNANILAQLDLSKRLLRQFQDSDDTTIFEEDEVVRLAELVIAFDEWITKGGFLPSRWEKRS